MLQHISLKNMLLLLLLILVVAGNAIELLEETNNYLLELKKTNTTKANQTDKATIANEAIPRQYPTQFGGSSAGGFGGPPAGSGFGSPSLGVGFGGPSGGSFGGSPGGNSFGGLPGGSFGGGTPSGGGFGAGIGFNGPSGCPLCDSSVYSYCSQKMLHDDCCCDYPVPQLRPPQCYYSDCALLYAKSCYEHALIKNCCCNNPF